MKQILWTIILYRWEMWSLNFKEENTLQLHKNKVLQKILWWETHCDVQEDKYPNTPSITTVFSDVISIIHNVLQKLAFYKAVNRHMQKNIRENKHYTILFKKETHLNLTDVHIGVLSYTGWHYAVSYNMQHIKLMQLTQIFIINKNGTCVFKCYMFQP